MADYVTETHPSLSHKWHSLIDLLGDSGKHRLRVKFVEEISSIVRHWISEGIEEVAINSILFQNDNNKTATGG